MAGSVDGVFCRQTGNVYYGNRDEERFGNYGRDITFNPENYVDDEEYEDRIQALEEDKREWAQGRVQAFVLNAKANEKNPTPVSRKGPRQHRGLADPNAAYVARFILVHSS